MEDIQIDKAKLNFNVVNFIATKIHTLKLKTKFKVIA